MIVVDTSVWSNAFRRRARHAPEEPSAPAAVLRALIAEHQPVALPGIVLQELLSGVRSTNQFNQLRADLSLFPVVIAETDDHVEAARIVNACMRAGAAIASIDALIAALTMRVRGELLTCDRDFERIADHTALRVRLLPA